MSETDVEVTGLDELAKALDSLPAKLEKAALRPALSAAGQVMRAALEDTVPVDTGALRESIGQKIAFDKDGQGAAVVVGPRYMGGKAAGYKSSSEDPGVRGMFLEFGTRKMAPRFWMR